MATMRVTLRSIPDTDATIGWSGEHSVVVDRPAGKAGGSGLGFNGGELLGLAIGGCFCNDLHYVAHDMGLRIEALAVDVNIEFDGQPLIANGLPERVIASCSVLISRRLAVGQDLATAFKNRGNAYDDKGDHVRAMADFGAALAINAEDADAFNSRGTTYTALASMIAPLSTSTKP